MPIFYFSIVVAFISSAIYHVFQKATPPAVNPAIGLTVTYATALVLSVGLLVFFPLHSSLGEALRKVNWASFGLGLAIVGLEIGFLLAYRAGWNLSLAAIVANAAAGVMLLPAGIVLYRERPSLINVLGVFLCIFGLVMVNWKK
ncbi:MAG TPA: EamA family transporter [Anaerolineales bacterium]|nr:EamA family transporter [Anaerolineales bacterium]